MRARRVVCVLALIGAVACGNGDALPVITVRITKGSSQVELRAEVAATDASRAKGLIGRRSLARGAAMFFLFPGPTTGGFWMKKTLIPLDIAFVMHGFVIEVDSMTPCRADPCPITRPAGPYFWAIEANPGTFDAVGPGAKVLLIGTLPTLEVPE